MQEIEKIAGILDEYKGKRIMLILGDEVGSFSPENPYEYNIIRSFNMEMDELIIYEHEKEIFQVREKWFHPAEEDIKKLLEKSKDTVMGYKWRIKETPGNMDNILSIVCCTVEEFKFMYNKADTSLLSLQDVLSGCLSIKLGPMVIKED